MNAYFNAFPIIHVRDAQRSLAFYRDLLGCGSPTAVS